MEVEIEGNWENQRKLGKSREIYEPPNFPNFPQLPLGRRQKQDVGYQTITTSKSMIYNPKSGILFLTPSFNCLQFPWFSPISFNFL
jgi:hypothetical protein